MRRAILSIAAALAVGLGALAVYVYTGVQSLEVRPVTSDVHMLVGWGGNVTVLRTERGAVVIDSMTAIRPFRPAPTSWRPSARSPT